MNLVLKYVISSNSVECKSTGIEGNWKRAHDLAGATGKELNQNKGIESFEVSISRYCRY